MPAYARPDTGDLAVTFSREGEEDDRRIAPDGVRAVTVAMQLLAFRDELRPGDRLTVESNRPRLAGEPTEGRDHG